MNEATQAYNSQPVAPATPFDRQAAVVANIQQLHDDYNEALGDIAQQKADIEQWRNRVALLVDDRDHYRKEAGRYRAQSIELATIVANIALLTMRAQEIVKIIHEDESEYQKEKEEKAAAATTEKENVE